MYEKHYLCQITNLLFMKKILTLIFTIVLCFNVKAQTKLTEAVDFTATDCYGEEVINLFEILDRGQYVFLDFFFYTCYPCQEVAPMVVEAYEAFGCNNHDVFFMEIAISDQDTDDICQWWAERYGVEYPTISIDGGGREIKNIYTPPGSGAGYPTLILIAPDRKILLQDINYDSIDAHGTKFIIESLEAFGIKQNSCEPLPIPEKPVVTANATNDSTLVLTWESVENAMTYNVYQGTDTIAKNLSDTTYIVTGLLPGIEYCFTITASNISGESEKSDEVCAKTLSGENIDEVLLNNFKIYPNPSSSEINIASSINGEAEINIYDMTGRCVKNVHVTDANNAVINVSDIEKGIYLINISGKIEKFIKN